MSEISIRRVGPEAAADVFGVIVAAFGARPPLDPPADALSDSVESIAGALSVGGGLVAEIDGEVVGSLILDPDEGRWWIRRFGVKPVFQAHGLGTALTTAAVRACAGAPVAVLARHELPTTIGFWRDHGFVDVGRAAPYVELEHAAVTRHQVVDADAMRELGADIATRLRAGDLLVLSGGLGAGKTTFTQGLGRGLGVRGDITSPTFVISRVHPSLAQGPALVHVDAYRLGGLAELDDLDLDTSFDDAVTVVEWGEGIAEGLATSRLEVQIERAEGADVTPGDEADPRVVTVRPFGPRWTRIA